MKRMWVIKRWKGQPRQKRTKSKSPELKNTLCVQEKGQVIQWIHKMEHKREKGMNTGKIFMAKVDVRQIQRPKQQATGYGFYSLRVDKLLSVEHENEHHIWVLEKFIKQQSSILMRMELNTKSTIDRRAIPFLNDLNTTSDSKGWLPATWLSDLKELKFQ